MNEKQKQYFQLISTLIETKNKLRALEAKKPTLEDLDLAIRLDSSDYKGSKKFEDLAKSIKKDKENKNYAILSMDVLGNLRRIINTNFIDMYKGDDRIIRAYHTLKGEVNEIKKLAEDIVYRREKGKPKKYPTKEEILEKTKIMEDNIRDVVDKLENAMDQIADTKMKIKDIETRYMEMMDREIAEFKEKVRYTDLIELKNTLTDKVAKDMSTLEKTDTVFRAYKDRLYLLGKEVKKIVRKPTPKELLDYLITKLKKENLWSESLDKCYKEFIRCHTEYDTITELVSWVKEKYITEKVGVKTAGIWDKIKNFFSNLLEKAKDLFSALYDKIKEVDNIIAEIRGVSEEMVEK